MRMSLNTSSSETLLFVYSISGPEMQALLIVNKENRTVVVRQVAPFCVIKLMTVFVFRTKRRSSLSKIMQVGVLKIRTIKGSGRALPAHPVRVEFDMTPTGELVTNVERSYWRLAYHCVQWRCTYCTTC